MQETRGDIPEILGPTKRPRRPRQLTQDQTKRLQELYEKHGGSASYLADAQHHLEQWAIQEKVNWRHNRPRYARLNPDRYRIVKFSEEEGIALVITGPVTIEVDISGTFEGNWETLSERQKRQFISKGVAPADIIIQNAVRQYWEGSLGKGT